MCLYRDIAVIFPEQKGVGVTIRLRAKHHCGSIERYGKMRVERQVVTHIQVCIQVTEHLQ